MFDLYLDWLSDSRESGGDREERRKKNENKTIQPIAAL